MKTFFKNNNEYDEETARKYIVNDLPVYCVTSFVKTKYEYVNNKRTENIDGYMLWFIQEGNNPFVIKFEKKPELPPFLAVVEFEKLQGIEVKSDVYFRANGLKVVKQ